MRRLSFGLGLGLGLGLVALAATAPTFLGPFALYLLAEILAWGLFALAFDLLFGYTGLLSLGHSVFFGVGAYLAASGLNQGQPAALALLGGTLGATLLGLILGPLLVRVPGHGFIALTLALAVIAHLLGLNLRGITGGADGLSVTPPCSLSCRYFLNLSSVAGSFWALLWLLKTPLGLAFQLVRENPERAASLGYNVRRIRLVAFTLSAGLAGLAGALYLCTSGFVNPEVLNWPTAAGPLIWTLLGGKGTLVGPLLGTIALLAAKDWLSARWPGGYPLLVGLLLILVVLFAPQGLVGKWREWRRNHGQR